MNQEIDLNCDLGEGGSTDEDLMLIITSANICCGAHAGSIADSQRALQLAQRYGVRVGCHPGYPDRDYFGRRELELAPAQVFELCHEQVAHLAQLAAREGVALAYLKPHGGLYHQACRDTEIAQVIVNVASNFQLAVMGLPGSVLQTQAQHRCPFIAEGFADRRYQKNGSLIPRTQADAFVATPQEAVLQVAQLVHDAGVRSICVHGDNPAALAFVRAVRNSLETAGFLIRASL